MSAANFETFMGRRCDANSFDMIFSSSGNRRPLFSKFVGYMPTFYGRQPVPKESTSSTRSAPYILDEATVRREPRRNAIRETALSDSDVDALDDEQIAVRVLACKFSHDLFGVERGHRTTKAATKKRFRDLARRLHPDKNKCEHATRAFQHLEAMHKEFSSYFAD